MFRTISITPLSVRAKVSSDYPNAFKCPIDQFDSKDFNTNDAGWIRNDISQLVRATSQSQYDAIMRRLVELKQEGGIPDDMTVEQAISQIKPRYAQSPNEIEEFIKMTNGDFMERVNAAYKRALESKSPEVVLEPAPAPVPDPAPDSK